MRGYFRGALWAFLAWSCVAHAQTGVDYLKERIAEGGGTAPAGLATSYQATAEAVAALRRLGYVSNVAASEASIAAEPWSGTEYAARRVIAAAEAGAPTGTLIDALLRHQNIDGGFGELAAHQSSVFDTAWALEAATSAGSVGGGASGSAIAFLLGRQGPDGGWARVRGSSDVFTSAHALRALAPFRTQSAATSQATSAAATFLLSQRGTDNLWSEDFLSALSLIGLIASGADASSFTESALALKARQLPDGSWAQDAYTTALALRALALYDAAAAGAAGQVGTVTGYVYLSGTREPLANAQVLVAARPSTYAFTNADGYFALTGVPAGVQTLTARKAGYAPASKSVAVQAAQGTGAGTFYLLPGGSDGFVQGQVIDALDNHGIAGASLALTGGRSYQTTCAADGSFDLGAVEPGDYSITVSGSGYRTVTGQFTVVAATTTTLRQALTPDNVYPDESPVTLTGRVVDGTSGEAVPNVALQLDGSGTVSDADGGFRFDAVARGNHQLQLGAEGYETRLYTFTLPPGAAGNLGDLVLFATSSGQAPTVLTLHGTVVDGLGGQPIAGATATIVETSDAQVSDGGGRFTFGGLSTLSFSVALSAQGYEARVYQVTASGYGDVSLMFALPPGGGDDSATETTLSGMIVDAQSGQPIADAAIALNGAELGQRSDESGAFQIAGIDMLEFTLMVSATGYQSQTYAMKLARHGAYTVELPLSQPPFTDRFRIESLQPVTTATGANAVQIFAATIANITDVPQTATIIADVIDGTGVTVATVNPYAPGTETPTAQFAFEAEERLELVIPWNTAQAPAGDYRVVLRLVEPGTITRELPSGLVLTSAETGASVVDTPAITGELGFEPPLAQAGSSQPVTLTALVLNSGNRALAAVPLTLSVRDPGTGALLHTADAVVDALDIGNSALVEFGQWVPTVAGDLPVTVAATDGSVPGIVTGTLYVGDKATGAFTVDRSVVPLGTQDVRASVSLQGVDTRTGVGTDPLFFAVKEAIRKGGEYVAPAAMQWKNSNQCLGCHIQTQSLLGLNGGHEKAPIDEAAIQFLFNDIAGSQHADGGLRVTGAKVPTALGMWSLSDWKDSRQVLRTLYRATDYMLARASSSGSESWWTSDSISGWWRNNDAMNMATVRGMSALLRHADASGVDPVDDFVLEDAYNVGISNLMDFEQGPDGWVYYVDVNGTAYARNLATGQSRTVAGGMPNPSYGIAVRDDGVVFVSSRARLTRINLDGTKTTLLSGSTYGNLTDVVIGFDGTLYIADNTKHRIWKLAPSGQVSTLASGGLLSGPYGLALDTDGSLLVGNHNRYNVLRITPAGAVTIFADGLTYRPNWIRRTPDGEVYVLSAKIYLGTWIPVGVWRIGADGIVERIAEYNSPNSLGLNGLGVVDGQVYVSHASSKHLYRLRKRALSMPKLSTVRQILPKVARYQLNRHKDGSTDNLIQSWRLITLGEVLAHTSDPALRGELETAMTYIANVLRQRQRSDGGWGRVVGNSSDPLVTSAVGLALEYTNPSVNDPLVRKTITYLLNKQLSDKSWPASPGIFSTRLGSTSFVMAYLPLALDRLGGIDVDLNLATAPNVYLSNPSIAPTSSAPTADGGMAYHWFLQGVTGKTRDVAFDLRLDDMAYQERRPVATEAWLGFHNSFTEEALRSDLDIPVVRAVSDLALSLATDHATYPADAPVAIASRVDNVGPPVSYGNVDLYLRLPGSTDVLADLGRQGFGALDQNAGLSLQSGWNTGSLPAGEYELYGKLYDQNGRLADEATTTFAIVHPQPTLIAAVSTDRAVYQAWDDVALTSRVTNPTSNASQPPSLAELTVSTPAGEVIHQATYDVAHLAAGAQLSFPDTLRLADAAAGDYAVDLIVRDELTRDIVATASTQFAVERDALQALGGSVRVEYTRVYQGDPNSCTDVVENRSAQALVGVTIMRSLVSLDSGETVSTDEAVVDLAGSAQQSSTRSIDTKPLALGNYACVLAAKIDGRTQDLGSAGFLVVEPPIRIDATLELGSRGRVLVLLDDGAPPASIEHTEPAYEVQRAYLEALLTRAGWSYTIVTDSDAFRWELRTGDYNIYALFAEHAKLDEQVQKELREAVYRGEGLVDAGEHDQRHQKFDDALGIKPVGKHADVVGVDLAESPLSPATYAELLLKDKSLRATVTTAEGVGSYVGVSADPMAAAADEYGRGRSAYLGFDLLAEATLSGDGSVFERLIIGALSHVEPAYAPTGAGRVVPVRATLVNDGIATPGRALLTVPEGVSVVDRGDAVLEDDQLIWTFDLAEEQSLQFTAWLRLPDAAQVSFELQVQSGVEPDFEDETQATLDLTLEPRPGLEAAQALAADSKAFKQVGTWLDKAAAALEDSDVEAAIGHLVSAADALIKTMDEPRADELRLMIDEALVRAGKLQ